MPSILIGIHSNDLEPDDLTEKMFDKKNFFNNFFFNFFFCFDMHFRNFKFPTYSQSPRSAMYCYRTSLIIIQKFNCWKFSKNIFENFFVHSINGFLCEIAVAWISASQLAEIHAMAFSQKTGHPIKGFLIFFFCNCTNVPPLIMKD